MKSYRKLVFVLAAVAAFHGVALAARGPHVDQRGGELLVRVRDRPGRAPQTMIRDAVGGDVVRAYRSVPGLVRVRLPPGLSNERALERLRDHGDVVYAEPDYAVQATITPNDPSFSSQWALSNSGQTGGQPDADID